MPKFLKHYFWDIDFSKLKFPESKIYVLKRLLDYGDEKALVWMSKNFSPLEIKNALYNFRGYSKKSANFWALIFGLDRKKVLCLKKRSLREQKTLWPY